MIQEKIRPGAPASATGTKLEAGQLHRQNTAGSIHSAMSKFADRRHKRAARDLGYTLTLGDDDAWMGFATVISARLTGPERARMAWAALLSLTDRQIEAVAEAALILAEREPDRHDITWQAGYTPKRRARA